MTRLASARKSAGIAAMFLLVLTLGVTVAVFVTGSASASSTKKKTTTAKKTTTTKKKAPAKGPTPPPIATTPASNYLVINGTVNAASDHEILGSSAFPNYATGAVDNYYSMAHSHVDNSPFAEGRSSPADTGPVGQTAAAGNTQQPQYADARWPGNDGKAEYGTQGQPYAAAEAGEYKATAEASEASSGLSGPTGSTKLATPKGFNGRLRTAIAKWKAKWDGRLHLKAPGITPPKVAVTTPVATVSTPALPSVGGLPVTPPVTVPAPPAPSGIVPQSSTPSRSLSSAPGDGGSLLESSTEVSLDPKTHALVTSGESRLGRVSLGGGQIVLEGIHVIASIRNDGTPAEKVSVTVASATIGGVPVTIDQDGVHVAGHDGNLPYGQASDALNTALKGAGIQLFLVSPEVTHPGSGGGGFGSDSCSGSDSGGDNGNGTTTTSTNPLGGVGSNTTSSSTTTTKSGGNTDTSSTTTTTSSGDFGSSDCSGTSGNFGSSGCATSSGGTGTNPTTSTNGDTGTTTTNSSPLGGGSGTDTTTTNSDNPDTGMASSTANPNEMAVTATGVHLVFTQPVDQPGVPAQFAEHILGEVYIDSLAVPAAKLSGGLLKLNLTSSPKSKLKSSPCGKFGIKGSKFTKSSGGASTGGGTSSSSAGGSASSGSGSSLSGSSAPVSGSAASGPAASMTSGGTSQPASASGPVGQAAPAGLVASVMKKPLWLLVVYLLWAALMVGSGVALWSWRRGGLS